VAAVNPSTLATGSHLLFMALGDGGPPAVLGLDAPDQGESQGPSGRWAILVGDQFQQRAPRFKPGLAASQFNLRINKGTFSNLTYFSLQQK
jgi:hypothetical protein